MTVRSNVFAIWVTVGYFDSNGNEVTPRKRNRAFYIFDRSIPVAYEQGKDHNVRDGILFAEDHPMSIRLAKIECHATRHGMTLVEMLVATTMMTLVIMGVVVQAFGMVGNGVSASRASLQDVRVNFDQSPTLYALT